MKYDVIVAEDEELILHNLIQKINHHPHFQVTHYAQTGAQALELINRYPPILLVTDIRMPVMDGMELLTKARQGHPDMEFVIVSGFSDFEYAQKAIHLKVFDYLLKPVLQEDMEKMLTKLWQQLELKKDDYLKHFSEDYLKEAPQKIPALLHDFIAAHYDQPLNFSLIAQAMNYSQSYLTKTFLQEYNCTPMRFLNQLRLQKACQLLIHNPLLSINQIAELSGYEDQGYFSRTFKKHMGISPLQYRKKESGNG